MQLTRQDHEFLAGMKVSWDDQGPNESAIPKRNTDSFGIRLCPDCNVYMVKKEREMINVNASDRPSFYLCGACGNLSE